MPVEEVAAPSGGLLGRLLKFEVHYEPPAIVAIYTPVAEYPHSDSDDGQFSDARYLGD